MAEGRVAVSAAYATRSAEQRERLQALFGPLVARIDWSAERLAEHRRERLRALLRHAKASSPWHAKRLAAVDPERFEEADLERLPPMNKADLMAHWDEIATDPRLSLARCEAHLDVAAQGPAYFENEYHVLASGGSSGRRGVFVYGWDEWAIFYATYTRWVARRMMRIAAAAAEHAAKNADRAGGALVIGPVASVGAAVPTHATSALALTFSADTSQIHSLPVKLGLTRIRRELERLQPETLVGYASAIGLLAREVLAGRLSIKPRSVMATSEPLLPETRAAIEQAFGVSPVNCYGTSDSGIVAMGCGEAPGMHLSEDELVIELVDAAGAPVAVGERAQKIFATSLFQYALPVIRYELEDEARLLAEPCPCGSVYRRVADIQGRADDVFRYQNGAAIHPHVFRSPLSRASEVSEYQVRQTPRGAEITLVCDAPCDEKALAHSLREALGGAGLPNPEIRLTCADHLDRVGVGKLKRFVALG